MEHNTKTPSIPIGVRRDLKQFAEILWALVITHSPGKNSVSQEFLSDIGSAVIEYKENTSTYISDDVGLGDELYALIMEASNINDPDLTEYDVFLNDLAIALQQLSGFDQIQIFRDEETFPEEMSVIFMDEQNSEGIMVAGTIMTDAPVERLWRMSGLIDNVETAIEFTGDYHSACEQAYKTFHESNYIALEPIDEFLARRNRVEAKGITFLENGMS